MTDRAEANRAYDDAGSKTEGREDGRGRGRGREGGGDGETRGEDVGNIRQGGIRQAKLPVM
jgi:hypothetical protein